MREREERDRSVREREGNNAVRERRRYKRNTMTNFIGRERERGYRHQWGMRRTYL